MATGSNFVRTERSPRSFFCVPARPCRLNGLPAPLSAAPRPGLLAVVVAVEHRLLDERNKVVGRVIACGEALKPCVDLLLQVMGLVIRFGNTPAAQYSSSLAGTFSRSCRPGRPLPVLC